MGSPFWTLRESNLQYAAKLQHRELQFARWNASELNASRPADARLDPAAGLALAFYAQRDLVLQSVPRLKPRNCNSRCCSLSLRTRGSIS